MLQLRERHAQGQRQKHERRAFEHLQLRFRRLQDFGDWWKAVCEAADRLDFAWVSLTVTDADGTVETSVWRGPGTATAVSRLAIMSLPLMDVDNDRTLEFEIAVRVNGSLVSASDRAALFSRLIDEADVPSSAIMAEGAV